MNILKQLQNLDITDLKYIYKKLWFINIYMINILKYKKLAFLALSLKTIASSSKNRYW